MIDGMDLDHVPLCKALRQSKCHNGARPQHRLPGSYISVAARFAPVHTQPVSMLAALPQLVNMLHMLPCLPVATSYLPFTRPLTSSPLPLRLPPSACRHPSSLALSSPPPPLPVPAILS